MESNRKIGEQRLPRITVSSSINSKVWELAKQHQVSWSDALEFGILFAIAEQNPYDFEYPKCDLLYKFNKLKLALEQNGK